MKKLVWVIAFMFVIATLSGCAKRTDSSAADSSSASSGIVSTSETDSKTDSSTSTNQNQSSSVANSPLPSPSKTRERGSSTEETPSQTVTQPRTTPSQTPAGMGGGTPQTSATPAPKPTPAPPPAPPPAPSPAEPTPAPSPAPVQPKGPYDYPFDIAQIQNDMIAWGQAAGMTHEPGARTPDNSSWDNPITASDGFQGDILRSKLMEYVQFYTSSSWISYGNEAVTHFTIYVSGTTFYVLH